MVRQSQSPAEKRTNQAPCGQRAILRDEMIGVLDDLEARCRYQSVQVVGLAERERRIARPPDDQARDRQLAETRSPAHEVALSSRVAARHIQ